MQGTRLVWVMLLGCGMVQPGAIAAPAAQIAQNLENSCRQTNATTGIYEQPSLDSTSRGVLSNAQTVRLELIGTGTGWARINQPIVGWIEARYLTPAVPCDGLVAAPADLGQAVDRTQPRLLPPASRQPNQQSAETSAETSAEASTDAFPEPDRLRSNPDSDRSSEVAQVTTLTCQVLPAYGLIVRRQPSLVGDTYLDTIPAGAHQFQFTRNTQTNETSEGIRRWVYITAPVEGWISLGYIGKEFNLGGECG